jgi:hypothetical protein
MYMHRLSWSLLYDKTWHFKLAFSTNSSCKQFKTFKCMEVDDGTRIRTSGGTMRTMGSAGSIGAL